MPTPPPPNWADVASDLARFRGTLVRLIRKRLRWSQAELARRASLTDRTVRAIERFDRVRESSLEAVVDALNEGLRAGWQLDLPFTEFELDEICFLKDDHGWSYPAPEQYADRKRVFMRLVRRELKHQYPYRTKRPAA